MMGATDLRIRLTQTQQLRMSHNLRLLFAIFQHSAVELEEAIDQKIEENPLLERIAERSDWRDRRDERSLVALESPDDRYFETVATPPPSLADHLETELRFATSDAHLSRLAIAIIGNLDEEGYLRDDLNELATRYDAAVTDVQRALDLVQSFDPPGVAARSQSECLVLQLRRDPLPDPVAVEIVEQHWDDLVHGRVDRIARNVGQSRERVQEAIDEVARLEARPGRRFSSADVRYITPDVAVRKLDGEWVVVMNDDGAPRLRVSRLYGTILAGAAAHDRQWVKERLRAARWFVECVYRRRATIRCVMESIVRFQREALEGGMARLHPLSLRDVAGEVGVHESTISRVARAKFVETPHGIFELRRFFTHAVPAKSGDAVSVDSAVAQVKAIVTGEDPGQPLSDARIAAALAVRGIHIKRRTVVKYREALGILSSVQRRRTVKARRCDRDRIRQSSTPARKASVAVCGRSSQR